MTSSSSTRPSPIGLVPSVLRLLPGCRLDRRQPMRSTYAETPWQARAPSGRNRLGGGSKEKRFGDARATTAAASADDRARQNNRGESQGFPTIGLANSLCAADSASLVSRIRPHSRRHAMHPTARQSWATGGAPPSQSIESGSQPNGHLSRVRLIRSPTGIPIWCGGHSTCSTT